MSLYIWNEPNIVQKGKILITMGFLKWLAIILFLMAMVFNETLPDTAEITSENLHLST